MAIIQPSALISGISGTLGGVCFKNTRQGIVAAKPRVACDRKTSHQLLARQLRLNCLGYFRSLPESRLKAWQDAARVYNRRNRLGLSSIASPWSLFLEANYYWVARGSSDAIYSPTSTRFPGPQYVQAWFPQTEAYLLNVFPDVDVGDRPYLAVHAARTFSPAYSRTSPTMVFCPNAHWEPEWPYPNWIRFQEDLESRQGVAQLYEMIEVSVRYYALGFLPSVAALTRWRVGPPDQPKP